MIYVVSAGTGIPFGVRLSQSELPITRGIELEQAISFVGPEVPGGGTSLITAGGAVAASRDLSLRRPTLFVSRAVVDPVADFPRHAAFPLLMGRLCNVLACRAPEIVVVSQSRAAIDPLWQGPSDSPEITVVPIADRPADTLSPEPEVSVRLNPRSTPWASVVLVTAMGFLVVDSLLRMAKRIV